MEEDKKYCTEIKDELFGYNIFTDLNQILYFIDNHDLSKPENQNFLKTTLSNSIKNNYICIIKN